MYGWVKAERDGRETVPRSRGVLLLLFLDLALALGMVGGMLDSLLGFGLFHGFLGLFGTLGAHRSALLALFLLQLLAAQQFDEGSVGTVALSPSGTNNAQVAALTIAETRRYGIEKP